MGAGGVNRSGRPADTSVRNRVPAGFPSMDDTTDIAKIDVDELWVREWAEEGIVQLDRYLACHAAFEEFLRRLEE